ncbi:MAG: hypothetical protein E7160_03220 [Firmicutes bacterium]|nr:hypothetical protein [Bacillota bacterium]
MKKIIFFLITIITTLLFKNINVYASTANFYEGNYIDGIYMNKRAQDSNTIYYQTARFFRQTGTNRTAYCIEPFNFFNENSTYTSTINPSNLSAYQKERISLIAHFGYGYHNHTTDKWYAITQFMIWKAADPTGDFYFTDTLNGKRIERFTAEMNEINNLINNYQTIPSITSKEYILVENETLNIEDINHVLNNYKVDNSNFKIDNNKLIADNLKEGTYQLTLTRESKIHNTPIIFYQSPTSQNLVETGDINSKNYNLKVNVIKTSIEITKIDSNNKTTTPSGDGELIGAVYSLYNSNMEELNKIEIDDNCKGFIENIPFGKYYIKEEKAGNGYTLDEETYEINISKDNPNITLTLENKIITAKIIINKSYESNPNKKESNVTFNIYNNKDELIKTIITNELGYTETYLPYGTYTIKQLNSKDGYYKVDDFKIKVTDQNDLIYNLTDYKIKVPNTKANKNLLLIIFKWIYILCIKELYLSL